jgi:hypothetical protein
MSKFEKVKAGLILENPNLTEKFFFSSFLSGLKEEVKYMVTAQHPNSVNKAYEHAMHYELALESASKKSRVVPRCRIPKERARLTSNYRFLSTYGICTRKTEVERDREETSKANFT